MSFYLFMLLLPYVACNWLRITNELLVSGNDTLHKMTKVSTYHLNNFINMLFYHLPKPLIFFEIDAIFNSTTTEWH